MKRALNLISSIFRLWHHFRLRHHRRWTIGAVFDPVMASLHAATSPALDHRGCPGSPGPHGKLANLQIKHLFLLFFCRVGFKARRASRCAACGLPVRQHLPFRTRVHHITQRGTAPLCYNACSKKGGLHLRACQCSVMEATS